MLHGSINIGRVPEESVCRSAKDYRFTDVGVYKIHSTALMPNIPFATAAVHSKSIDTSIFINDTDTMPTFNRTIKCQNFLSAQYIGRAPLEWYGNGNMTSMGRQFILICKNGNPNKRYRTFGTEAAIHGYNKNASENVSLPSGDDE
jgi:hypothetical protein